MKKPSLSYPYSKQKTSTADLDVLQKAITYGIVDEEKLQQFLAMQKDAMLKQHPYAVKLLPSGRWQTYIPDPLTGKRRELKASTKEKLADKLYMLYQKAENFSGLTMTQLYEDWLEYKTKITESPNTVKRHKQHFHKYFEQTELFQMPVSKVDRLLLQSFCNQLVKHNNLSSKEWTNIKTILKGMFEYALDQEWIERNPMERVRIAVRFRQIPRKTGKTETFNTEEQKALNAYLDQKFSETHDLAYLAVRLNFYLGLRVAELVALKAEDRVDFRHLHIQREEVRDQEANQVRVVEHTKTNTDRFVPLVPKAIILLDRAKKYAYGSEYLFTRKGKRFTSRQIAYVLEKYAERTGRPKKSTHKVRKTYASNLNAHGVPIDEIRELLGHANLQTTLSYVFNPLTEQETYERIKNAL